MKSRNEIVIIMLQWLRRYTLGSRGSRELKTFIETRLISLRVDQKLKNKEGKYMLLKREIGPKSWAIEAVVGTVLQGRGSNSLWRIRSSHIGREFRFEFSPNSHHFSHDRATIEPRSGHDRTTIRPRSWSWPSVDRRRIEWRRFHHVNSPIAARSHRDRGSIGPRSWSSSMICVRRRIEIRCSRYHNEEGQISLHRGRRMQIGSRSTRCSHSVRLMKIHRS